MAAGLRVGGRYRLDEVIGAGGMGVVWRAYDERLHRSVAVKEIRYPSVVTAEERADLTRRAMVEARSAARLDHPGIVAVHDVVEEDDRPWIVMRLVAGRSLDQVVRQDGPLGVEAAARLGLDLVDALTHAHAAGVVHRDVKPSNVLVQPDGRILLTDFSIAQVLGVGTVTKTGVLLGSPGYIAPERMLGGGTGPAADLFGLGATLYFAVEGRGPFDAAEPLAGLFATANQPHPRPVRAGALESILDGLLAKSPDERLTTEATRVALESVAAIAVMPDAEEPDAPEPADVGPADVVPADVEPADDTADSEPPTVAVRAAPPTAVDVGATATITVRPNRVRTRRAAVVAAVAVIAVIAGATMLGDFFGRGTDGASPMGLSPSASAAAGGSPTPSPTAMQTPSATAAASTSPSASAKASSSPKPRRTSPSPRRTTASATPRTQAITAKLTIADSYLTANCNSSVSSVSTRMTVAFTAVTYPVDVEYRIVGGRYGPWKYTERLTALSKTFTLQPNFDAHFDFTYHFYVEVLSPVAYKSASVPLQVEFCPD